jgi:hypothetical protein
MEGNAPQLDAATRAALQTLADIAVPPPIPWMPQTWEWAALAILLAALVLWGIWRWYRHRVENRYRREALDALSVLESQLDAAHSRAEALAATARLIKRTALAAWPRATVASLSGADWVAFLRDHAGGTAFPDDAAIVLDDAEYGGVRSLEAIPEDRARAFVAAARRWIEVHHVSA